MTKNKKGQAKKKREPIDITERINRGGSNEPSFDEPVGPPNYIPKSSTEEMMEGTSVKRKKKEDAQKYWARYWANKRARQAALEKIKSGVKSDMEYQKVKPIWDIVFKGRSSSILREKQPEDFKTDEEKKAYEKRLYKVKRAEEIRNWFGRKKDTAYKAGWSGEAGKEAGPLSRRVAVAGKFNPLRMKGRGEIERVGLKKAKTGIVHAGAAMGKIGGAFGAAGAQSFQPIQIFTMAWKRMSVTLKWLIILVFLVVILFVPWGVFYYTGWAVGAAFMFLISLIYWVFASFFNAIAYVLVTAINAVASIVMGVIIWIVEFFMSLFMKPNYFNPKSQAYEFYWQPGHALFDNSLLKYSDIATVPILMVPIKPDWQPWMNQILIVKFFELVPGAQAIANAFGTIGDAMGKAFQDIIIHSPPWVVILIGLLPVILVISIVVWIYLKYRHAPEMTS